MRRGDIVYIKHHNGPHRYGVVLTTKGPRNMMSVLWDGSTSPIWVSQVKTIPKIHPTAVNINLDDTTETAKLSLYGAEGIYKYLAEGKPLKQTRNLETGEERSVQPGTGAMKGVKPQRHSLIPPEALNQVAEHYGVGAEKYEPHNWRKGYDWSKSYDALQRHATAFWDGQDMDPETGTPHMAAVAFHALTLLTFMKEHPQLDDRYKTED